MTVYTLVWLELEICAFHGVIYMKIQSKSSMRVDLHKNGPESN